jgi:hypothetical protein
MKRATTFLAVLAISLGASVSAKAAVHVRGYYRSNGTYVQPHYRSNPDGNFRNNWSTYPNVNPYTGAVGTKRTPPSSTFSPTLPSYRVPSQSQSSYLYTNPYTGATGTKRSTGDLGSLSYRTPTYNWNTPNLWNSRSPSAPSFSQSSRDSLTGSLWKK